ncbi:hypothetical protein [Gottfriedia acidiceleris]|uniref:hypothetical protein n=1 Tax=Gottfriedia acidiceleris TaxID=371036 RepID=UPI003D201777
MPIHPHLVYDALRTVGVKVKTDLLYYKIPTKNLVNNLNVVYLYRKENYKGPAAKINSEDIHFIDIEEYEEITKLPIDTRNYYEEENKKGNKFGMFPFIPHILSLGEVSVLEAEVLNWSENCK